MEWLSRSSLCPLCRASVGDHLLTEATSTLDTLAGQIVAAVDDEQDQWCKSNGLSKLALQAVAVTVESTEAVLLREAVREAFFNQRNLDCPPTMLPARVRGRPISSELASVADAVGDGVAIDKLKRLVSAVLPNSRQQSNAAGDAAGPAARRWSATQRGGSDDAKLCTFYMSTGQCRNGDQCRFRHGLLPGEQPPKCPYIDTDAGCRFGSRCWMSHGESADMDDARQAAEKQTAEAEILAAGSRMLAGKRAHDGELEEQRGHDRRSCVACSISYPCEHVGLRQRLAGRKVLMVGEGEWPGCVCVCGGGVTACQMVEISCVWQCSLQSYEQKK